MSENGNLNLTQLGSYIKTPNSPEQAIVETFENPHSDVDYLIRFTCPEFTSLCPVTGQPDFAHMIIDYTPDRAIIESKSLKLFLTSYRNHKAFQEMCTVGIGKRLYSAINAKWLRISGYWFPRGGIPIDIFFQIGKLPKGVWLPEPGVTPYRGRG